MPHSNLSHILVSLILLTLLTTTLSYIDIELAVTTSSADVSLNMPLTINDQQYHIAVSIENKEDFIVAPEALPHAKKKKVPKKANLNAVMHVWSLQGYTLEGWKRFFLEVFLFEDSKYSHTLSFNLSGIKTTQKQLPMTNGLMAIGPQLQHNKIYQLIKEQAKDYFKQDIVSFYTVPGGKDVRMQLGGYEQENARGYNNGVRFYQKPISTTADGKAWVLPVIKLIISKQRSNKWESYTIPSSGIQPRLSLQSQFIILPEMLKEDLQTSFESENIQCSFSDSTAQLQCSNISSIDEALTFLSFYVDNDVSLNISLYDLRAEYNNKDKLTSFFVKLGKAEQVQIGAPLLKGYYISLNLQQRSLLFSPLNRFTPEISTAEIIRFVVIFMLFMFFACACIVLWQQWNMPKNTRHRFTRNKDGVRLVAYQKPSEFQEED